jgi:hypothetical protein
VCYALHRAGHACHANNREDHTHVVFIRRQQ